MNLKLKALRNIIREEVQRCHRNGTLGLMETTFSYTNDEIGLKVITSEMLAKIAPEAMEAARSQLDENDLNSIWVMTEKPILESTDDDGYETWSQTNEPELATDVAENWDQLAVNVAGKQIVIFCGTFDDEYGYFWDASQKQWQSYNY